MSSLKIHLRMLYHMLKGQNPYESVMVKIARDYIEEHGIKHQLFPFLSKVVARAKFRWYEFDDLRERLTWIYEDGRKPSKLLLGFIERAQKRHGRISGIGWCFEYAVGDTRGLWEWERNSVDPVNEDLAI